MNFDFKKFKSLIPKTFNPILDLLIQEGFGVTLVGGSIRDFLLFGKLGKDWDIELSHETLAFDSHLWKDLGKRLSSFGKLSFLPYDIIRLDLDDFQLEFSPPRTEHYKSDLKGHSNFEAEFNFRLPFEKAVLRRDFTLNALGVRFEKKGELALLDPLKGMDDLQNKLLNHAGEDFSKDPVRYLRAQRFAIKFHLKFSHPLEKLLNEMDLEHITHSYLWKEMQKSLDPVEFLERILKDSVHHPELRLPLDSKSQSLAPLKKLLYDPTKHESWIMALEWCGYSAETWTKYFSLGADSLRKLSRWAQTAKVFQTLLPENFHGEFDQIKNSENFEKLFDWYFSTKQLLQKYPELPLLKMIEDFLPEWIHLYKFEAPKDVKHIEPPFRAKYQVWNLCQRL